MVSASLPFRSEQISLHTSAVLGQVFDSDELSCVIGLLVLTVALAGHVPRQNIISDYLFWGTADRAGVTASRCRKRALIRLIVGYAKWQNQTDIVPSAV